MTSYTLMQFVGSVMLAQVGPLQVAAQGNGGIWSFVPLAFLFGGLTVVNSYVAQNLGAGRLHAAARYGWAGLWFSGITWLFILVPYGLSLPRLFSSLGHSPELAAMESSYAQVLVFGGIISLSGKAMSHFFFGLHRPKVITIAAIAGNLVNILTNFILIYGEAGLPALGLRGIPGTPALGVTGAAIATVLGTAVEVSIPLTVFLSRRMDRELGTRRAWRPQWSALRDLVRTGWPAGIQFGNEIFCWAIFMSVLVGRFGELHLTAGWAVLRYMHLSFMPAVGFSVATTSLVGRYIGAGNPNTAVARAHTALLISVIYMALCGIMMWTFSAPLVSLFAEGAHTDPATSAEIVRIGSRIMLAAAVFQAFDAVGIVYSGALRGAGDTLWPGVVTIVLSWVLIVGLGWGFVVWTPGLESLGPWIASAVYIAALGAAMGWRFEKGPWRTMRLVDPSRPDDAAALVAPITGGAPELAGAGSIEDIADAFQCATVAPSPKAQEQQNRHAD